jgi:outer membrane protein assembly factor BamB
MQRKPLAGWQGGALGLAALAGAAVIGWMALGGGSAGAATGAAEMAQQSDWTQWLGPQHNGISAEAGWNAKAPKELWKVKVGEGYSTVSVAKGRVYTMGNIEGKDIVWCLDAATGKEVWKHSYPCGKVDHPGTRCTPTVDGDRVYTLSHEGALYCLKTADGTPVWNVDVKKEYGGKRPQWGFACSPLVQGDQLIIDVGPLVAVDKATGKMIWKAGEATAGYSSPVAFKNGADSLIAGFNESGTFIVTADGKPYSKAPWKTSWGVNAVTPIVDGGQIFISSGYGTGAALYDIAPDALKVAWQNKNMKNHANNCVLYKGCLYGFDGQVDEGPLTCIDWKTGVRKWAQKDVKGGGLMIADGKLILVDSAGELVMAEASADGYKELSKTKILGGTCWTMPVLSGGRIYCRNQAGDLVCMDAGGK